MARCYSGFPLHQREVRVRYVFELHVARSTGIERDWPEVPISGSATPPPDSPPLFRKGRLPFFSGVGKYPENPNCRI